MSPTTAVLARSENAPWVQVGDEIVVYQSETSTSYVLSQVAGLVWQCLDGASALDEILADVADVFGVAVDQVTADFVPVAEQWLEKQIAVEVT